MIVCGIDPGKKGGIVFFHGEMMSGLFVTPLKGDGDYDINAMGYLLKMRCGALGERLHVFIEEAHAFPLSAGGSHSMFVSGYGFGLWVATAAWAEATNVYLVGSQTWQSVYFRQRRKTAGPKEASIAFALEKWPDVGWIPTGHRKVHDGLTDAACIAEFGRQWLAMPEKSRMRSGVKCLQ